MLNDIEYNKLKNLYNNNYSGLIIVKGNLGMGKSYVINSFIKQNELKTLHIMHQSMNQHPLQGFIDAIFNYYLADNNSRYENLMHEFINYEMCIQRELYYIYKSTEELVIWFEGVDQYTLEFLKFISRFIKTTLSLQHNCRIIIIMEYNQDRASLKHKHIIYELESIIKPNSIILFNKKSDCELKAFIDVLLNHNHMLSNEVCKSIIHSAFYNPLYIIRALGYLKEYSIIYIKDDKWMCDNLNENSLKECVDEYISIQYNILDAKQKNIVQKAAITGYEINIELLEKPLNILDSVTYLASIERKTDLISHQHKIRFSTQEVYHYILNHCTSEDRIIWHRFIAEYLEHKSHRDMFINPTLESVAFYSSLAFHYESCEDDDKALQYYVKCITICRELEDYYMINMIVNKLLLSPHKIVDPETLLWIEYNQALAKERLGNYYYATELYNKIIKSVSLNIPSYFNVFLRYKYAYNLYNCGKSNASKMELKALLKLLKTEGIDNYIRVKTLDLLSAICSHFGEDIQSERYYNYAVKKAKELRDQSYYYLLVKNCNMFCSNELAIPYLEDAYNYFNENNMMWEQALISYNMGVSLIHINESIKAIEYMDLSEDIFKRYNSKNIHYPINAKAVIYGINGNYVKALELFIVAHKAYTEFFSDVYLLINQSHCYRKLGNMDECLRILHICSEKIINHESNTYYLERNLAFSYGMYHYEIGEYQYAIKKIEEAFNIEKYKLHISEHIDLFTTWLVELSNVTNLPLSDDILKYQHVKLSPYKERLFKTKVLWGNFMFWGI